MVGAFAEGEFEAAAVFGGFGDFWGAAADEFGEAGGGRVHAVEAVFTGTPGADEACVFEEAELGGDAALFHAEDFLDFGDGEFGAIHEQEQSEPCGLADQAEGFDDGGHGQSKGPGRRSGKEQSAGGLLSDAASSGGNPFGVEGAVCVDAGADPEADGKGVGSGGGEVAGSEVGVPGMRRRKGGARGEEERRIVGK